MLKLKLIIFLKRLFYVCTVSEQDKIYRKINLLGFRFSFRDLDKELDAQNSRINNRINSLLDKIDDLSKENQLLRIIMERSIDIKKVPPAKGNLRKVQLIKTKLLEIVTGILKQNNINFWLDYGTLIGAIRHNGFIPWDDDIDVSLLKEDYLKLPKVFENLEKINQNFKFSYEMWEFGIYRIFYKDFCIDFFPFEYINQKCETSENIDNFVEKWHKVKNIFSAKNPQPDYSKADYIISEINRAKQMVFGMNYVSDSETAQIIYSPEHSFVCGKCAVLNTNNIFPLKEHKFENLLLPIPNCPIEHLFEHRIYGKLGDVMNFPKIQDSGFNHVILDYEKSGIDYDSIYNELSEFAEDYIKVIV